MSAESLSMIAYQSVWAKLRKSFHVGDGLGYGGLRNRKLVGCLAHAAASRHRHQDMKIAKLQLATNSLFAPRHALPMNLFNGHISQ
jgi:hypothetical protein